MRLNRTSDRDERKKKREKRRQLDFENLIFSIMQKSLKAAMDEALNDVMKSWNAK